MGQKTYNSLKEFIDEFIKDFNFVPDDVKTLWTNIIDYADASNERGAEGNSGEFSNEKEQERLEKLLAEKEQILIENFGKATGYEPVFVRNTIYPVYIKIGKHTCGEYYHGAWDFKEVKSQ